MGDSEAKIANLRVELKKVLGAYAILALQPMTSEIKAQLQFHDQRRVDINRELEIEARAFAEMKRAAELTFTTARVAEPHPCSVDWNDSKQDSTHYHKLLAVQQHKCVGTYCQRRKQRLDGTEYGAPYCRLGFPCDLTAASTISFDEPEGGGVRAVFTSKRK